MRSAPSLPRGNRDFITKALVGARNQARFAPALRSLTVERQVAALIDSLSGRNALLFHTVTVCLIVSSIITAPGCSLKPGGGKVKPVAAAPKPAAPDPPQTDTASDLPISVPQTQVTLPSPQPIQAEALATVRPESQPSPEPANPAARPPRSTPPRNDRQQAIAPPQPAAPQTPAAQPSRVRIRPVESAAERKRLMTGISARKRQVQEILGKVRNRTLTEAQKSAVERIQAFLEQTDAALKDQDLQQADALSNRALVLSQVLN